MKKRKILVIIITLIILTLIFYKIDFVKLIETFKKFNYRYLVQIVLLYIITLIIRGLRWKYLLNNDSKYSAVNLSKVFTVGSMLNAFVPARAGDLYRAYYLGSVMGENKIKIFGSVILERIFDGISVFVILLLTVVYTFNGGAVLKLTYITGGLFLGSFLIFFVILKYSNQETLNNICLKFTNKLPNKIKNKTQSIMEKGINLFFSFIEGFRVLENSTNALLVIILSFLIWLIEAFIAYLLILSFGFDIDWYSGLYVMALTSFSTVIPSASVFLGPYQIAYIMALGLFGISKSSAIAVSTIHQAIFMIILAVIGIFYFLKFNISLNDVKKIR